MQLIFEIFPIFLFFITFKLYDIYMATIVAIVATSLQVVIYRQWKKVWDRKQLATLAVFVVFGGMTLYFHDPIFVKWKPTVVFWLFSLVILGSHFFSQKPLIQRLMESAFTEKGAVIPTVVWKRLNLSWAAFFCLLGTINLYVAYAYSIETWVNFKFYGISGALILFSILQAVCLMRYIQETNVNE